MHLIDFFDRGVQRNPRGLAFVRPDGTGAITYEVAYDVSHRVAHALDRAGLGKGDAIGVLSGNNTLAFPMVLGVLRANATWVALNAKASPHDLAHLLTAAGAAALIYDQELSDLASELSGKVASLTSALPFDSVRDHPGDWASSPGTRQVLPPVEDEATAALFSTGGTTGESKAVEVPHRAFEAMVHGLNQAMPEEAPVHLVAAPMTHAAGALVFPVLAVGGTNIVHARVDAGEILESIAVNRVTRIFLPPTAIYMLLDHESIDSTDFSSLRHFIYGAAPMSVEKLRRAIDVFGPVMSQFYGQVEVPMICTFLTPDDHAAAVAEPSRNLLASCGRASAVARVAVMDENGRLLEPGERGEVVVRSSLVMKGYRGAAMKTSATQTPSGWHATGDIGYLDADGYLFLVDRKRDLIISGGFNIFPSEVEQVLWSHPAVKDCAVIGVPDDKWGERVIAVVETAGGATVTEAEIIALCKGRLGSIKAPKAVLFRDLPRSPVGKVLKKDLRAEFWIDQERRI